MSLQTFSGIWETLEKMISDGELISSSEILDELKDEMLTNWAIQHRKCFLPLSKEIQDVTKQILKQFPSLIQMKSVRNSNADPFLIATAIVKNGTVVTNEKPCNDNSSQVKIPNVCNAMSIPCITLQEFINQIMP